MSPEVEAPAGRVVGREDELAQLDAFVAGAGSRSALVLDGEPGAGKTTLWEAAVEKARARGVRVLAARPSGAEAGLSFTALTDLLEDVDLAGLTEVPAPQRAALQVALLRAEPSGTGPEPRAISTGLLNVLRELGADGQLVVAIDDVQWLDEPSADALAFTARRLDKGDIRFLLAKRSGPSTPIETAVAPVSETLQVAPLSLGAMRRLLLDRLGLSPPRRVLQQIHETSAGNPLFALELGRIVLERGAPAIGEDMPVPDAVDELLSARVANLPRGQRRLLVALALSPGLRVSQIAALGGVEALEDAVENGIVVVEGDRVRPSHPLLAAVARKRARTHARRELHRELAEVVAFDELRARHLALATPKPDAKLAGTVAEAAAAASARGARQEAVELAEHALRLTPPDSAERSERVLALAAHLETAGELHRVTDLLQQELESIPPGSARARGWLLLSEGAHIRDVAGYRWHLEQALAEARDDPALHARVVAKLSTAVVGVERIEEAEALALDVLPAAREAGPDIERPVLFALAWARGLRGRAVDDLCERWTAASTSPGFIGNSPERIAGQRLAWRGRVDEARAVFERLLALADERGERVSYTWARIHLCEVALRTGSFETAERQLDEWEQSTDGELFVNPIYQRCRALLAAGRGVPDEAERWAGEAIAQGEAIGTHWDWLEALRARGVAAGLAHDHERAAESFRTVWEHTEREGVLDSGVFPVAPELVEALAELGESDEAQVVARRLEHLAREQDHPWGLATVTRCAALIGFDQDAFVEAASAYETLGLAFDQARTLLALGRGQRRLKQWGGARRSLEQALAIFQRLGAPGWAAETQSGLDRLKGRRPHRAGELTPAEERVAALAAEGLSNKQIAARLYVTVHTVEVHLKHVYAKLGVTSRAQLPQRLTR